MTTKTQTPGTKIEETPTVGAMTSEQLAEKQAELQALSESLEDKEKGLLEKEQELTTKEAELESLDLQLKNELETKVEELRVERDELFKKEEELTAKEAELENKEADLEEKSMALNQAICEEMEEGEVSLEQFLRENSHPDGIQYSEFVLKVTNGPESHLEGYIRPNPYGGQTKSVKITATLVRVN